MRPLCPTVPTVLASLSSTLLPNGNRLPSRVSARSTAARPALVVSKRATTTAPAVGTTACVVDLNSTSSGRPRGSISMSLRANGISPDTTACPHGSTRAPLLLTTRAPAALPASITATVSLYRGVKATPPG